MSEDMKAGDKCLECAEAGLDHKLRYFYINLKEQILKCEHRTCLWPHNDEVSSDDEESIGDDDKDDDEFLRNLLNFTMDNRETVETVGNKLENVLQTTTNPILLDTHEALNIRPEILNVTDLVPTAIASIFDVKSTDQPATTKKCDPSLSELTGTAVEQAVPQKSDTDCYLPVTAVLPSLPDLTDLLFDFNSMVQMEPVIAATTPSQSLEEPPKDEGSTLATVTSSLLNELVPPVKQTTKETSDSINLDFNCDESPKEDTGTTVTTQLNKVLSPLMQPTKKCPQSKLLSMPTITYDFQCVEAVTDKPPKEGTGTTVITQSNEEIPNKRTAGTIIMEQHRKKFAVSEISQMPAITFDFSCLQPNIEVNLAKPQPLKCNKKDIETPDATQVKNWRSSTVQSDNDESIPKAKISNYFDAINNKEKLNTNNRFLRPRGSRKNLVKTPIANSSESFKKLRELLNNKIINSQLSNSQASHLTSQASSSSASNALSSASSSPERVVTRSATMLALFGIALSSFSLKQLLANSNKNNTVLRKL